MDVSAGRDSTRRRGAAASHDDGGGDGGAMEAQIVQLDLYDSARAKIEANLRWLFGKAYGTDHIPAELRDPFYTDQYEQEHIKPPIIRLLLSGELYCRVCGHILPSEQAAALRSHQAVLQTLSKRGIHVLETNDTPVSDLDLSSSPIKMSAHIHLIDALMTAYTVEMFSIEKAVASVRRFTNFSASKELPYSLEDAMVFWINKVNLKMRELAEKECKMKQHLLESPSHQKPDLLHALAHCMLEPVEFSRVVRYRRDHLSGRTLQHFPVLEDLLKDVCDGTALLTVIHFYCPEVVRLEDICLKEVPSIADSVYNIQLLTEFSNEYLNKCFYMSPEDLLYSPPVLKNNLMVFIAELFWWFESVKPDFVQPRDLQEIKDVRLLLQPKGSCSFVPVSNATKRRFLPSSNSADALSLDLSTKQNSLSPSHSLPPLRQGQQKTVEEAVSELRNRPNPVTQTDGQHQGSILAWPERRARPLSSALSFSAQKDAESILIARSISKDSLASNIIPPKHMLPSGLQRVGAQNLLCHVRIEDEEEETEEEELVSVIHPSVFARHRNRGDMEPDDIEVQRKSSSTPRQYAAPFVLDQQEDSYYLEPLMPAVPKPAKEKSIRLNKQEESGEMLCRSANVPNASQGKPFLSKSSRSSCYPTSGDSTPNSFRPHTEGAAGGAETEKKGFFLHFSGEQDPHSPLSSGMESRQDSDSDVADLEEDEEDEDPIKEMEIPGGEKCLEVRRSTECGDGESAKLREDLKVSERDDKEDVSGRSSPCLSTVSCASSCSASGSVRMTSFAEKKLLKLGLRDGYSSTSSSQKTTPDGSETAPAWQGKEPSPVLGKSMMLSPHVVPSELLQLHMQLEEQRRAIEYQKKKMETFSARQRLKLGKAAFLNIVKKGGGRSDTLPLPLKHSQASPGQGAADRRTVKTVSCKDDSCLDALKGQTEGASGDNRLQDNSSEPDLNECSRSIDLLNEAISSIQQQMMQLTLQQDLLMKQSVVSPPEHVQSEPRTAPNVIPEPSTSDSKSFAVHFVDIGGSSSTPARRPPRLSSSQRRRPSEQKETLSVDSSSPSLDRTPSVRECPDEEQRALLESSKMERSIQRNVTFRVGEKRGPKPKPQEPLVISKTSAQREEKPPADPGNENVSGDESSRNKALLIEVDLSELKDPQEEDVPESTVEGEQKNVLGFFFKDDEKAEDEMAKRRAAFLLKQQRKAEEARLRKQQQESEAELKRDEARRKAEEERIRKEEEKARRELIKQEYLRRKQQALLEEQGLAKPHVRTKSRRNRPKSLHREEPCGFSKGSTTPDLSLSHRGSTLSLATETDSVHSGEAETNRAESVCSMESFPMLSRASSRNMERDWENGSIASSITSSEYNGPKLFKEPSSKSNKPIIINAIAHCCLAGKVNEVQKNVVLEELEKCECNHLIILFRDGGCQFRAIYTYSPETEEIAKFSGTGPRSIHRKMIDKLYKYSSDRKQFTIIPAKSVSASVDALTIHNHLWQIKRPGSARRK
uniref:Calmodulin regulated spectrin associated protein 1 n=1 Tax=Oryzias melastigma TaxID=30732 RepID=A0A3B3BT71_ORYME